MWVVRDVRLLATRTGRPPPGPCSVRGRWSLRGRGLMEPRDKQEVELSFDRWIRLDQDGLSRSRENDHETERENETRLPTVLSSLILFQS